MWVTVRSYITGLGKASKQWEGLTASSEKMWPGQDLGSIQSAVPQPSCPPPLPRPTYLILTENSHTKAVQNRSFQGAKQRVIHAAVAPGNLQEGGMVGFNLTWVCNEINQELGDLKHRCLRPRQGVTTKNPEIYLALFQEEKQKRQLVSSYDTGGKVPNAVTHTPQMAASWDQGVSGDGARGHS